MTDTRLDHVAVLPARPGTHYVGIPPAHRRTGPGLHWHVPHNWSGRYLTEPAYLAAALTPPSTPPTAPTAAGSRHDPPTPLPLRRDESGS